MKTIQRSFSFCRYMLSMGFLITREGEKLCGYYSTLFKLLNEASCSMERKESNLRI